VINFSTGHNQNVNSNPKLAKTYFPKTFQTYLPSGGDEESIVCLLSAEIYCFITDIIAEQVFRLSKVWNIVFAIVGCCVLTFVNNTKTIHNFVGRYRLSVKKM